MAGWAKDRVGNVVDSVKGKIGSGGEGGATGGSC